MKYLFPSLVLLFLMACGNDKNKQKSSYKELGFSFDTVMVDAGEEILFLNTGLRQSTLSKSKRYLFNFNQNTHSVEKIDLDELKWVENIPFELEGPNGTGNFFHSFLMAGNDSLLISGPEGTGIFNLKGEKIQSIDFYKVDTSENRLQDGEYFSGQATLPDRPNVFLGYLRNWEDESLKIAIVNLPVNRVSRVELPAFNKFLESRVEFSDERMMMLIGPEFYMVKSGEKVLLGSNFTNALYQYIPQPDSLAFHVFESQLTANEKTGKYPAQVESQDEIQMIHQKMKEEINFHRPVWDELNQVYFRFSHVEKFNEETKQDDFSSPSKSQVFLTVLDKDLHIIAESPVPVLTKAPTHHFAKDGKIWMFENIEDELGFVRISIDEID